MGGGENNEVSEEFVGLTDNIEPHPEKGGIKLTGYLTYNCLSINEDASQVNIFMISVKPRNIFSKKQTPYLHPVGSQVSLYQKI